jgi:superfamily II DNA or RNA helicase
MRSGGGGAWPWASGIHAHATGTGKSVLMLTLLRKCIDTKKDQSPLIYWICERKNILKEQFDSSTVKKKGFHFGDCIVFRFDQDKKTPQSSIYESRIWGKPRVVIINRTYLTYSRRYRSHPISDPITMVLHDECHTATNKSSVAFYEWLRWHSPGAVRLGFTATPADLTVDYKEIYPHILTRYSIYNAIE